MKIISHQQQLALKRILDFTLASISLFFCIPLIVIIGIAIKADSPGPIIYKHSRIGKDGRPFNLYKFRTMLVGGDDTTYTKYLQNLIESEKSDPTCGKPYRKMEHDERITRVGSFLRCYYLDELPQFVNILKGEMSLVGPRPHVQLEVDNYTPQQHKRLSVKPGATGLWQVAGKSDCTFNELIGLDLQYIENWSIWLDFRIILKTFEIFFHGGEKFWADGNIGKEDLKGREIVKDNPALEINPENTTYPVSGVNAPPDIHTHPTAKFPRSWPDA